MKKVKTMVQWEEKCKEDPTFLIPKPQALQIKNSVTHVGHSSWHYDLGNLKDHL